jgi:hypothetical protein
VLLTVLLVDEPNCVIADQRRSSLVP